MRIAIRALAIVALLGGLAHAQLTKPGGGFVPPTRLGGMFPTGCTAGQTAAWNGATWACADGGALVVSGTLHHFPLYAPDGHHLGDSPATFDSSTSAGTAPLTAIGTLAAPVHVVNLGGGEPAGNPTYATTATDNGAGSMGVGTYKWAYYENDVDSTLNTGLSPASSPLTLAASHSAFVTTGQIRRGMAGRILCRTKAGGSTYYAVHNFGGGADFFDTMWVDNTPDSSLVTLCPTVDTTKVYSVQVTNDGVKWFRTHPSHSGPADSASLTSDPLVAGTYVFDHYGSGLLRTINGTNLGLLKTGRSGDGLLAGYTTGTGLDTGSGYNAGNSLTRTFFFGDDGTLQLLPSQPLIDAGLGLSTVDRNVLSATATFPAVATATNIGVNLNMTGNGSSSFEQDAVAIGFSDGYRGSGVTRALSVTNNNASAGVVYGASDIANGLGTGTNVGHSAIAQGATHNVALYAGLGAPITAGLDSALVVNNGTTAKDLIQSYNNGTQILEEKADGTMIVASAAYLDGNGISGGYTVNASGNINYGFGGYQGGATQFRTHRFFDGEGNLAATITGSTKKLDVFGAIEVSNLATWTAGAGAPAISCSIGDEFSRTDGGVGTALYTCTATNTWTAMGGGTSSLTNSAGANVVMKSDGTNAVPSSITDNGTNILNTEQVTISRSGAVSYTSLGNNGVWNYSTSSGIMTLAANSTGGTTEIDLATSAAGAAVARMTLTSSAATFGVPVAMGSNKITGLANGTASSDGASFGQIATAVNAAVAGTNGRSTRFTGANLVGNGAFTDDGTNATATGTVTGASLFAGSTNGIGWGNGTTQMFGANSGSWTLQTASTNRIVVDNAGLVTNNGALTNTGAVTHSSTLHQVGAATFDSTLGVTGLATLTGGFNTGADGVVNGNLTVTSRLVYKDAQMDQGTLFTLASGTAQNLKGATSGTFTASGTTETVTYGITFTTVPSCLISTEGTTKGYGYTRTTTQLSLTSLVNGQKYDWECKGH